MPKRSRSSSASSEGGEIVVYGGGGGELAHHEQPIYDEKDKMLVMFKPTVKRRAIDWVDKFKYNLMNGNNTVVEDPDGFLNKALGFMNDGLKLHEFQQDFWPTVNTSNLSIVPPVAPVVTHRIGWKHDNSGGGSMSFYFFDTVRVTRGKSNFGEYFNMRWDSMHIHNQMFGNLMKQYMGKEYVKLQTNVFVDVPIGDRVKQKTAFVRQFFDIKRKNNTINYTTGDIKQRVVAEAFDVDRYEEVFKLNKEGNAEKPSDEVEMFMGAIVLGVKSGKDVTIETVNNKKSTEKPLSLAIKPMVFFYIE